MRNPRTHITVVVFMGLSVFFLSMLPACGSAEEEGACYALSNAYNTSADEAYCLEARRGEWIDGQCYCHGS